MVIGWSNGKCEVRNPQSGEVMFKEVSPAGTLAAVVVVGLAVGILLLFHSLGGAIGAALGGYLFDAYASYAQALGLCAAACLISSLACASIGDPLRR